MSMIIILLSWCCCRTTGNPEVLLVNQLLLMEAVRRAPTIWPFLKDYNELVFGSITVPDRGRNLDVPFDPETHSGFLGSGRRPKNADLPLLQVGSCLSKALCQVCK